jgi:PAS domain-containing protein
MFAFDRDVRFIAWNRAMQRISGLAPEAVLGKSAFDVFPLIAVELERAVAPRKLGPVWSIARMIHYLGLEHELVSPLLAVARIPCWTACFLEQQKLSRS